MSCHSVLSLTHIFDFVYRGVHFVTVLVIGHRLLRGMIVLILKYCFNRQSAGHNDFTGQLQQL